MADKRYKWDIEEMRFHLTKLKQERDKLKQYVQELKKLRADIDAAWTSLSGDIFDDSMDIDSRSLEKIITQLGREIKKLEGVIDKDYEDCESKISDKAMILAAEIKAI